MLPELKRAVPLTDVMRTRSREPARVTTPVAGYTVLLFDPPPIFEEYPYERLGIATIMAKPFTGDPVAYPFVAANPEVNEPAGNPLPPALKRAQEEP